MRVIKSSTRIIDSIVGAGMSRWFAIEARQASSGAPTFTLFYRSFRGAKVPLMIDVPLREVREGLRRFAEANTFQVFPYAVETAGELLEARRFDPSLLTGGAQ